MKIHTPKPPISSSNSDRQFDAIDRILRRLKRLGIGSTVGALAGAIGIFGTSQSVLAQNAITSLNASYATGTTTSFSTTVASPAGNVGGVPPGSPINLSFGSTTSNDLFIKTFDANSRTFNFGALTTNIFIRRDRKSTRLNSSHRNTSRMPSSA